MSLSQPGWSTAWLPATALPSQPATQTVGSWTIWSGSSRNGACATTAARPRSNLDPGERADAGGEGLQHRDRPDHLQDQHLVVVRALDEPRRQEEDGQERDQDLLHDVEDRRHLRVEGAQRVEPQREEEAVHSQCPPSPPRAGTAAGGSGCAAVRTRALTSARFAREPTRSVVS